MNPLTPSFLKWRNSKRLRNFGAVAVLSSLAMRTQQADHDRDFSRRANAIASNRAADDHSIADNDKIEATVSSLGEGDDVAPTGMESSAVLLKSERNRLAAEVAAYRKAQNVGAGPLAA